MTKQSTIELEAAPDLLQPTKLSTAPQLPAKATKKNAVAPIRADAQVLAAMTPMEMLDRAVAQNAGVDVIEKLMGLQERWEANQARKAFDEAISKAKSELPVIVKDKAVRFDANKPPSFMHETLSGIAKLIDPVLSKHGLSYRFRTVSDATTVTVTCIISGFGHSEENSLCGPHDKSGGKNSIQAVGSSVTYLQRYSLKAALGIAAADDDDGHGAGDQRDEEEKITGEQEANLIDAIEACKIGRPKFCTHYKIDMVAQLPARLFTEAMQACTDYKAKREKK